jgi:hypothetical protein
MGFVVGKISTRRRRAGDSGARTNDIVLVARGYQIGTERNMRDVTLPPSNSHLPI